jgi:hypothetical protein
LLSFAFWCFGALLITTSTARSNFAQASEETLNGSAGATISPCYISGYLAPGAAAWGGEAAAKISQMMAQYHAIKAANPACEGS